MDSITLRAQASPNNALIKLPVSKSIANRVLCITHLAAEKKRLRFVGELNEDIQAMSSLLETSACTVYDTGPAGTVFRFLTALLAIQEGKQSTLTGSERMKQRPISVLVNALLALGADIEYLENEGFPPLKISGKQLKGKKVEIDAGVSSQYISALALIGPKLDEGLEIVLKGNQVSKPYLELTLNLMRSYGIEVVQTNNNISIKPGQYKAQDFLIENDWSAASYAFQTIALSPIGSSCRLQGLSKNSLQGDAALLELFRPLGVNASFSGDDLFLEKTPFNANLIQANLDLIDQPDLAQTLVVTHAALGLTTSFSGLKTLSIKETDRLLALKTELEKLGAKIEISSESLQIIEGVNLTKTAVINTYKDHRMAMAFAPLACILPEITILDPNVVQKSFPSYWKAFHHFFA